MPWVLIIRGATDSLHPLIVGVIYSVYGFWMMEHSHPKEPNGSPLLNVSNHCQGQLEEEISMLQDINLQPDTQPLDDSFEMEKKVHIEGAWGQLYPSGTFSRHALKLEIFRTCRAKTSDYGIMEFYISSSKWPNAVTKCQCKMVSNSTGVCLREKSSDGIWVIWVQIKRSKWMPPNLEGQNRRCKTYGSK